MISHDRYRYHLDDIKALQQHPAGSLQAERLRHLREEVAEYEAAYPDRVLPHPQSADAPLPFAWLGARVVVMHNSSRRRGTVVEELGDAFANVVLDGEVRPLLFAKSCMKPIADRPPLIDGPVYEAAMTEALAEAARAIRAVRVRDAGEPEPIDFEMALAAFNARARTFHRMTAQGR